MPKQIQRNQEIYIAPGILGKYEDGIPIAIDERSENKRLDPRGIDDKITIYEREVNDWFLNPAESLLNHNRFEHSFIILMVCMSYFEGVEQYKTGVDSNRRSKDCFVDSVKRLYPNQFQDNDLGKLYTKSRCGLFHNGMVKGGVIFNNSYQDVIAFENNGEIIKINPEKLLLDIKRDFAMYINELRFSNSAANNEQHRILRENFDRMFSVL